METRSGWGRVPMGPLLFGTLGVTINLALLVALGPLGGLGPSSLQLEWSLVALLGILTLVGLLGLLTAPFQPATGMTLVLLGCLPGMLAFLNFLILGGFGGVLTFSYLWLPSVLMIAAGSRLSGLAYRGRIPPVVDESLPRCSRCGIGYTSYPNPWGQAGYCSKKCLTSAR